MEYGSPRILLISFKNDSLRDKLPGMEGIYVTEPKLHNGKQHLKQDSGEYEIVYEEENYKIENKKLDKVAKAIGFSYRPHEITDWEYREEYLEGISWMRAKGLEISVEEDCIPDSDYCQGNLVCGEKGICYYPHLIQKKCCMQFALPEIPRK